MDVAHSKVRHEECLSLLRTENDPGTEAEYDGVGGTEKQLVIVGSFAFSWVQSHAHRRMTFV